MAAPQPIPFEGLDEHQRAALRAKRDMDIQGFIHVSHKNKIYDLGKLKSVMNIISYKTRVVTNSCRIYCKNSFETCAEF